MCILCEWEDDCQDDPHADEVWDGSNGDYSLTGARLNFVNSRGEGGMYRLEDVFNDFQRVQKKFPYNRQLIKVYEQLIQPEALEELALKIEKIRKIEG